jgi:hypothetical protein
MTQIFFVPQTCILEKFSKKSGLLLKILCSFQEPLCMADISIYKQVYVSMNRKVRVAPAPNQNTLRMQVKPPIIAWRGTKSLDQPTISLLYWQSTSARPTWSQWFRTDFNFRPHLKYRRSESHYKSDHLSCSFLHAQYTVNSDLSLSKSYIHP